MKDAYMQQDNLRIDPDRLLERIGQFGTVGALEGGGVRRLALSVEDRMTAFVDATAKAEGVDVESRTLARFVPVDFDPSMIALVEKTAGDLGHTVRRIPSGAGHDARMFALNCPTAMIFVPSRAGISHNVEEFTQPEDIRTGAGVLLQVMLATAG